MALTERQDIKDLSQQQIRELQNVLLRAGYNPGPIDGVWGPRSRAAYQRFLTSNGYGSGVDDESGWIIRPIDQMSKDTPGIWDTIVPGSEGGTPPPSAPTTTTLPSASAAGAPADVAAATNTASGAPPPPPIDDGTAEADVRENLPQLAYLLDVDPQVRQILLDAAKGGWPMSRTEGALWKTDWYQKQSLITREWDEKFHNDPATAMALWDQRSVVVGNMAAQMGFTLPEADVKWVAGRVLREGWSDEQLKRFLGKLARQGGIGPGQVTEQAAKLKAMARNYMNVMTEGQAQEYAIRIAEGTMTSEAVESMMRNDAKARFSWLAPQIDAGLSPMDLFGQTRNVVAQELEIDPNQIDLQDPKWAELTQGVIGEDRQLRSMNYSEIGRWARQRPEWRFTDNANKKAADLELNLLKTLGAIA